MIIFAIPSAKIKDRKRILKICSNTGCSLKIMPYISELHDYYNLKERLRPVKIEDLLGRNEVNIDVKSITGYIKDKTVLITGGGGSIGTEIARHVMTYNPTKIIIFDINENSSYRLLNELRIMYGSTVNVKVEIGSVREVRRLEELFRNHRPEVVFHAAAHKHVPFMEECPSEAVKNNILGTLKAAQVADRYEVKRFVLISTDKAVNPTSVMGATKRVAEMIIQSIDKKSETKFTAVRFGNVLGSDGSVVPLFKSQIEEGGPVTVTHPNIKRYFMTISEAAKLVIQSGAMAGGGEIFVLDMGEQIKIMDLARNMIRLSGLIPEEDIRIKIIGLRPGEKMYEEMLMDEEGTDKTHHNKIFIGKSKVISYDELIIKIDELKGCI
jgi:FlaA1/EpsC-like NDP-sugar epimerase